MSWLWPDCGRSSRGCVQHLPDEQLGVAADGVTVAACDARRVAGMQRADVRDLGLAPRHIEVHIGRPRQDRDVTVESHDVQVRLVQPQDRARRDGVPRRDLPAAQDRHLHEAQLVDAAVPLGVLDTGAGREVLHRTVAYGAAMAGGVLVQQRAAQDPGDDLDVAVRMHVEAGPGGQDVLVMRHQQAELRVRRVVVRSRREAVPRDDALGARLGTVRGAPDVDHGRASWSAAQASRSPAAQVLTTVSAGTAHAAARSHPYGCQSSCPGACASVSIDTRHSASTARRSRRFGGSSRSGLEFTSTATPNLAQAAKTISASNSDGGRLPRPPAIRRPVQWPRMSVCGLAIAATMRGVISADGIRSPLWTLATTRSSLLSNASVWSSRPSSRMSTSMPVRIRNGANSSLSDATTSSCCSSRSAESPRATVKRGEWSVRTRYSWPRSRAVSAISRIGDPPSDQSECVWQSPRSAARNSAPASATGVPAVASSRRRYTGSSPRSDSVMHRAVTSPMPGSSRSVPAAARSLSSAGVSDSARAAADRNALTRKVGSWARSSRNAMRRRSATTAREGGTPSTLAGRRGRLLA